MEKFNLFVDPEKLNLVILELNESGFIVTKVSCGGPEALIYFEGDNERMEAFLENNSFEINEDSVINQ
jgi:hypothetical protein